MMLHVRTVNVLFLVLVGIFILQTINCELSIIEPTDQDLQQASRDPITVDVNVSPALSENEMYRDILQLTAKNFTEIVLNSKDPWVVIFHDGSFYKTWKTMASSMRGVLWFGLVNKKEAGILKTLKIDAGNVPPAMVFPFNAFGSAKTRREKAVRAQNPMEARKRAVVTLPDNLLKLDKDSIQDFLIESYVGSPAKFPTVFITYERETPPLMKALCIRFSEYFHFGIMYDPNMDDLKALGLENMHIDHYTMLVLIATAPDPKSTEPELSAVFFDKDKMGEFTYPNIVHFLFQINEQYRISIPGDNKANDKRVATMSDILAIERRRFQIIGNKEFEKEEEEEEAAEEEDEGVDDVVQKEEL